MAFTLGLIDVSHGKWHSITHSMHVQLSRVSGLGLSLYLGLVEKSCLRCLRQSKTHNNPAQLQRLCSMFKLRKFRYYTFQQEISLKKIYDEVTEDIFEVSNVNIFKEIEKKNGGCLCLRSAELIKAFGSGTYAISKCL